MVLHVHGLASSSSASGAACRCAPSLEASVELDGLSGVLHQAHVLELLHVLGQLRTTPSPSPPMHTSFAQPEDPTKTGATSPLNSAVSFPGETTTGVASIAGPELADAAMPLGTTEVASDSCTPFAAPEAFSRGRGGLQHSPSARPLPIPISAGLHRSPSLAQAASLGVLLRIPPFAPESRVQLRVAPFDFMYHHDGPSASQGLIGSSSSNSGLDAGNHFPVNTQNAQQGSLLNQPLVQNGSNHLLLEAYVPGLQVSSSGIILSLTTGRSLSLHASLDSVCMKSLAGSAAQCSVWPVLCLGQSLGLRHVLVKYRSDPGSGMYVNAQLGGCHLQV